MANKEKALQFAGEGYQITVEGRHVNVTPAMKDYAVEKISKIDRFTDRVIDVQVTMDIQKREHRVDILMKVDHIRIKSHGATDDMYISVDHAVDRLTSQLRRYRKRITEHHAKGLPAVEMQINVYKRPGEVELEEINEEIDEENRRQVIDEYRPHPIIERKTRPLKILTLDEAIMKMELSRDMFMVFRHEVDHKIKVIYRTRHGDYGIIEPE